MGYGCFCTCMGAPPFAVLDCITYIPINIKGKTLPTIEWHTSREGVCVVDAGLL